MSDLKCRVTKQFCVYICVQNHFDHGKIVTKYDIPIAMIYPSYSQHIVPKMSPIVCELNAISANPNVATVN